MALPDLLSPGNKKRLERVLGLGTDNAALALSEMVGKSIFLRAPELGITSIESVCDLVGGSEAVSTGICLLFDGSLDGTTLLLFPAEVAEQLAEVIVDENGTGPALSEIGRSALAEVGNLVASYFLTTISDHTGLELRPTSPMVTTDMAAAIITSVVLTLKEAPDEILFIKTVFADNNASLDGYLFFFTSEETLANLLRALEVA